MPTVDVRGDTLEVRLSWLEKLGGLLGDLDVPLDAVRRVEVLDDGLRGARGLRAPGTHVPAVVKLGTWRRRGGRQYVAVRRGMPALLLDLTGQRWTSVLVATPRARELAGRLLPTGRQETAGGPT